MKLAPVSALVMMHLAVAAMIGCNSNTDNGAQVDRQQEPVATQVAPESAEQYPIRGQVTAVSPQGSTITIDHEDIEGFMKAMTMEFQVDSPQVLEGIEQGDQVQGQLIRKDGQYIITELQKQAE